MPEVGRGVSIPFVIDFSDIPKSVKQMEKYLQQMRKRVGDIDLRIDGKGIEQVNRKNLIPFIRNFYELEEKAKRAANAMRKIESAAVKLRGGAQITKNFVTQLSKLSGVGAKTVEALENYRRLGDRLKSIDARAGAATHKMQLLKSAISTIAKRGTLGAGKREQLGTFVDEKTLYMLGDLVNKQKAVRDVQAKTEKNYVSLASAQRDVNEARRATIKLLAKEYVQYRNNMSIQGKTKDVVAKEELVARERALSLLRRAGAYNKQLLEQTQRQVMLEVHPQRAKMQRTLEQHTLKLARTREELIHKYRLGIASQKELVRLYQVMLELSRIRNITDKQWLATMEQIGRKAGVITERQSRGQRMLAEYTKRTATEQGNLLLKRRLGIITDRERVRLAEVMAAFQRQHNISSGKFLRLQREITREAKKSQRELAKDKDTLVAGFRSVFNWRRGAWFVWLRLMWDVYRVIGAVIRDLTDLDEAVGRAMRTMRSNTLNYTEVAERSRAIIIETGRLTGAAYKDIGEALYQLSSAGLTAEEALAAVNSVMRLTKTTEAEVTDATKVIAGVFNNFRHIMDESTSETEAFAKISGTLSYVWERNQVDMNEMVQALNQSAQVSQLAGVTFDKLTVLIGNLGTMMIRSGRAGRSLRTAIIQMASKGEQLAKTFGFTFDPTQPLSFMRIMDAMHEKWKDMNQTALVTAKITQIFGRRGAPAILALLKNWEKVREEIEGVGSALELATAQQEKLLRLQERYRQVSETAWKEIVGYIAEYSDVVELIRLGIAQIVYHFREARAEKLLEMDTRELMDFFRDSGALMEEVARTRALFLIQQERLATEMRKYEGIVPLETTRTLKLYEEAYKRLHKAYSLMKSIEVLQQDRAYEEELIQRKIMSEAEAWGALTAKLLEHRAERGDLVYSHEETLEAIQNEFAALDELKRKWVANYVTHRANEELLDQINKDLAKQSDVVAKLVDNLVKLHKRHRTELQKIHKEELEIFDARIAAAKRHATLMSKWAGIAEDRAQEELHNEIVRLGKRRAQLKEELDKERERLRDLQFAGKRDIEVGARILFDEGETKENIADILQVTKEELDKILKQTENMEIPPEVKESYNNQKIIIAELSREYDNLASFIRDLVNEALLLGKLKPWRPIGVDVRELSALESPRLYPETGEGEYKGIAGARLAPGIEVEATEQLEKGHQRELELYDVRNKAQEEFYKKNVTISDQLNALSFNRLKVEQERNAIEIRQHRALIAQKEKEVTANENLADSLDVPADVAIEAQGKVEELRKELVQLEHQLRVMEGKFIPEVDWGAILAPGELETARGQMESRHARELAMFDAKTSTQIKYFEYYTSMSDQIQAMEIERISAARKRVSIEIRHQRELIAQTQQQIDANERVGRSKTASTEKTEEAREAAARLRLELQQLQHQLGLLSGGYEDLGHDLDNAKEKLITLEETTIGQRRLQGIVPDKTTWEALYYPADIEEKARKLEQIQERESLVLERKLALQENYATAFNIFKTKEQNEEAKTLRALQATYELDKKQIEERIDLHEKLLKAQRAAFEAAFLANNTEAMLAYGASVEETKDKIVELVLALEKLKIALEIQKSATVEAKNERIRQHVADKEYFEAATLMWATHGQTIQKYAGEMTDAWKEMFATWGKESKRAWDVYKGLAIAEVIASSMIAIWSGWAQLSKIPYVGIPMAIAYAATVAAKAAFSIAQIQEQKPASYARGGIADSISADHRRSEAVSYASGGITSGLTAIYGDNVSGKELVVPSENVRDDYAEGYIRDRGKEEPLNIVNLVTQDDVAVAMMSDLGKNVVVNHIGADMNSRKSTFRSVRRATRRQK